MHPDELAAADATARRLAAWAAAAIREAVGQVPTALTAHTKSGAADWVTATDVAVERHVRAELLAAFPAHRVIGEEQGASAASASAASASAASAPTWHLDPIDGTGNFVHQLPWFSFSLGLVVEGEIALGVVADPMRGEVFHARRGVGAFRDGEPLAPTPAERVSGGLVLTELAGHVAWEGLRPLTTWLGDEQALLRVMGSCALSLASVAAGRASAVVLRHFAPWDVAAGVALCRAAGLVVRDGRGRDQGLPTEGLVAGSATVVDALWRVLRSAT